VTGSAIHAARVARLRRARRWAPVIGAYALPDVGGCDLVVVDGLPERDGSWAGAAARLAAARQAGALVLAYLSVGTVEDWRPYAAGVPADWTLGPVLGWEGERYADARRRGWRALMARQAGALQSAGFDGLFLDNLDVAEEFPDTKDAVVALVAELRATAPALLLCAQNGLAVADRLPIDALGHEDTWWRCGDDGRCVASPPHETAEILGGLRRQRARGLTVLTLDYTAPGAPAAQEVVAAARAEGFVPAVSVLALDRAPHAPVPA
jgi:uncharacterized protein (TIGR01370 family)